MCECVCDLGERKAQFTVICITSAPVACVEITKVLSFLPEAFSGQVSGILPSCCSNKQYSSSVRETPLIWSQRSAYIDWSFRGGIGSGFIFFLFFRETQFESVRFPVRETEVWKEWKPVYACLHHDGLWHGWDMEELFWGGAYLPHLPTRVLRSHPAALQAQLLPGLHQRGLGQRLLAGSLPRVQSCLHPEAQPGEEPQTIQHSWEVQRPERGEGHHADTAVHSLPPGSPTPRREGLPALQRPVLPVTRPDTPAAAVLSPRAPVGGGGGGEGLDLPPARRVQAVPLRGRADGCVSVLLLRPLPSQPRPRRHWCGAATQWHQSKGKQIQCAYFKHLFFPFLICAQVTRIRTGERKLLTSCTLLRLVDKIFKRKPVGVLNLWLQSHMQLFLPSPVASCGQT